MLTALGYDISRLRSLSADAIDSPLRREIRLFEDPRTGAQVDVTEHYSHEAPGVTIRINPGQDGRERETITFHYDSLRGSVHSVRGIDEKTTPVSIGAEL